MVTNHYAVPNDRLWKENQGKGEKKHKSGIIWLKRMEKQRE